MEDMGVLATDWVLKAVQGSAEDGEHDQVPATAQMLTPSVVVRESTSMINR
jgi:hypothetical protein